MFLKKNKPFQSTFVPASPDRIRRAILEQAVHSGSHDLLLESTPRGLRVSYRVQGVEPGPWRYEMLIPEPESSGVMSAFREAYGLDSHRRGLEVGLILFEFDGVEYDAYASFLPVRLGEQISIRISPASDTQAGASVTELLRYYPD